MSLIAGQLGSIALLTSALPVTVPKYQTYIFALILLMTLVMLVIDKVHKSIIVLLSAGLCLFLAAYWGYFAGVQGHMPVYIEMIEWEVIGIIIGATVFVEIAARSGVFTWISIKILKASRGDPFTLLVYLSLLTVVFSAFLDNITAMIIIGSLTLVALRKLKINPVPFLVVEGIMTNLGGLLTLISSIPNIIIGKTAGISYLGFLGVCTPYVVLAVAGSLWLARWLFRNDLTKARDREDRERRQALVEAFDEWETVEDKRFFYTSIVVVIGVILAFAFHSYIPLVREFGIEIVALGAAVIMLLLHSRDVEQSLEKVEWSMVFFFVGLFTVIGVIEKGGVLYQIGLFLAQLTEASSSIGLMWLTALFSSVTDNIPLAAMLAKIFGPTPEVAQAIPRDQWWAIVFGANLGGNITPIGSASTVVAVTMLKAHKLKLGFVGFVKIGALFAALQLVLASVYLLVLMNLL